MVILWVFLVLLCAAPVHAVVTATHLTTNGVTSPGSSLTTAPVTPSANKLLLLCVFSEVASGVAFIPTATGNGTAWVMVATREQGFSRQTMFRAMTSAPTAGALTFDWQGQTQASAAWSVFELGNVDTGGTSGSIALVRAATNSASPSTNAGATLATFFQPENATVGCFGADANVVLTPGSGYSEVGQSTTGGSRLLSEFRADNDTSVGASAASSATVIMIGAEICAGFTPSTQGRDEGQFFGLLRWLLEPLRAWAATCPEVENPTGPLPVFPGAEGFGIDTPAGRGGTIYKVTNPTLTSGAGSFNACVKAQEPRVCVFETSGVINTAGLRITSPYLTVAGATAPSPGIMLLHNIQIETHDVYFSHVAMRSNDQEDAGGYITRGSAATHNNYNIVMDHVSSSWGVDTTINLWEYSHDVTISNSIISEGLRMSIHNETGTPEAHSMGLIIGACPTCGENVFPSNIAVLKNLFVHNETRNPLMAAKGTVANNVIYNYMGQAISFDSSDTSATTVNVVGNSHIQGPAWNGSNPLVRIIPGLSDGNSRFYLADNCFPPGHFPTKNYNYNDPWTFVDNATSFPNSQLKSTTLLTSAWPPGFVARSCRGSGENDIETYVKNHVGTRPTNRNITDTRIINEVTNRSGVYRDCVVTSICNPGDVQVPTAETTLAVNTRSLTIPTNPNGDDNSNGYTNLEEYLHQWNACRETVGVPCPP